MVRSANDIYRDLARVTDALLTVGDDDPVRRFELLSERDALRSEARLLAVDFDEQRPTADIIAELRETHHQRSVLVADLASRAMASGPGGTGMSAAAVSGEMARLSIKAKRSSDLARMTQRLGRLESLLTERGVDVEQVLADGDRDHATTDPSIAEA